MQIGNFVNKANRQINSQVKNTRKQNFHSNRNFHMQVCSDKTKYMKYM